MKYSNTFFVIVLIVMTIFIFLQSSQASDEYSYDSSDRLEKVVYDDGQVVTYSYDNLGNRQSEISYASANVAPQEPTSPFPADGVLSVPLQLSLQWVGGDPNDLADQVTYSVYLNRCENDPSGDTDAVVKVDEVTVWGYVTALLSQPAVSLEPCACYYWRVEAVDRLGLAGTPSQTWSFTSASDSTLDSDSDGIFDDGDLSCIAGDNPCVGGETLTCDDNCPDVCNPQQLDGDLDDIGDVCDNAPGCGGCGQVVCEEVCTL